MRTIKFYPTAKCLALICLLFGFGNVQGQIISTFAGNGNSSSPTGNTGPATAAAISVIYMAKDGAGNIYTADQASHVIRKIDVSGNISIIAGSSTTWTYGGDGGPATAATMNPYGIAADAAGNIYFSESFTSRVRKINTSGIITTVAGNGISGYSGDGGPATAATLKGVSGLAVDASGNLYICDQNDNRIRKVNAAGIITTVAGTGLSGPYTGEGIAATATNINGPVAVTTDGTGNIYYSEMSGMRVRKISASGIINTVAGNGNCCTTADTGVATASPVFVPVGVAVDANGNVFFASNNSSIICRVDATTGRLNRVAGTGSYGSTGDGGPATAAKLNFPRGIIFDNNGDLLIADNGNNRIRKVYCRHTVTPVSGASAVCVGAATTLTDTTTGGAWISGSPTVASVGTSGVVSGLTSGTSVITYSVANSCNTVTATKTVTVNAGPAVAAIGGATSVCAGANTTLTNTTTGGTWTSSSPTIATVSTGGVVRGNAAGTATISYSVTGTCGTTVVTKVVTVNAAPSVAAISGSSSVCVGANITLTNTTAGGTWSSSSLAIASVSTGGVVRGNTAGTATISYTVTGTCGTTAVTKFVTVNALPAISAISGSSSIVVGSVTTLTSSGTAWSSSNATIASVNATTGVVTGVAAGTATISCSATNTCGTVYATFAMTVNMAPVAPTYLINTIAGTGIVGYSGDGGTATSAQFSYPYAVAVSSTGNLYIADQVNNRIRKVTPAGVISTIAGNGAYGNTGDGGAATAATLANPTGVAVDAAGNVYIADFGNNRIRKISTAGVISNFAGSGTGIDGGAATAADVYHPSGVAVDASGNVYIAETGNHRVRKVNTSGIISTVAGTGVSGYSGDGSAGTAAMLSAPVGVSTDAAGNVYIADLGNNRIRKITGGIISTVAGNGIAGFSGDGGAAVSAAINTPYGMTLDGAGNMYICDYNNFRIRKVNAAGVISTIAGTGTPAYGGDGGLATVANLNRPTGIAVDASGNIYVADVNNQRVRKLSACTAPVSGTITGPSTVAVGHNITLSTTGTGGTWSSVFTAKATISTSGMVHAIATGVDTIKYTVTNACGTSRSVYVVSITASKETGNEELPATESAVLNVYPNPSNGLLNLETATGSSISMVQVFNVSGKMMQQVNGSGNMQQVDISDYTPGMYILRVMQGDGQISQVKVMKE